MAETLTFNPDIKDPNKETNERLLNFKQELIGFIHTTIDIEDGLKPQRERAKNGQKLAKLFLRCAEKSKDTILAIAHMTKMLEIAKQKYGLETRPLISGFKGEYASGVILHNLHGVTVEYPTDEEDLKTATDFKIIAPDKRKFNIQTKTISLEQERTDLEEKALPVLSKIETIPELEQFLDKLKKLTVGLSLLDNNNNNKTTELNWDLGNILQGISTSTKEIEDKISVIVDVDLLISKSGQRITELVYSAIRMYLLGQKHHFSPVMCVLGSPESLGSDINSPSAEPLIPTQRQAEIDFNNL